MRINVRAVIGWMLVLCSLAVQAAELVATVSSKQVNVGQAVVLRLSIVDAKSSEAPDLTPLLKNFTIYARQQFSSYSNVNGNVTAEAGWDVTLLPKSKGKVTIPSVVLNTNKGLLRSAPIEITVDAAQTQNVTDQVGISLSSTISKNATYVQEPIIYTLKIISYRPWANISLVDIKSTDAFIEKVSEPKQYDQNYGGMRASIIEVKYYVTPLTAGDIQISAPMVQGEIQNQRSLYGSLFDFQPFAIEGEAITIKAKAAPANVKNWLPLQDLIITEEWGKLDNVREGDTITRKIKLVARGGFGSQLPDLQRLLESKDVKIYANKPVIDNSIDAKSDQIIGVKDQEFSIVPRHAGTITLPEIKISWWNLRTNSEAQVTLPAKQINVLAGSGNSTNAVVADFADQPATSATQATSGSDNKLLYTVIVGFSAVIVALLLALWLLWRRMQVGRNTVNRSQVIFKSGTAPQDLVDLRQQILNYAQQYWHAPSNIDLHNLNEYLVQSGYVYDQENFAEFLQVLNAALYAKRPFTLSTLVAQWVTLRKQIVKKSKRAASIATEPLNPT